MATWLSENKQTMDGRVEDNSRVEAAKQKKSPKEKNGNVHEAVEIKEAGKLKANKCGR